MDQVQLTYNDFGQLIEEDQEHSGVVSSSPSVQYGYDDGSSDSNQIRPNKLIYPNARRIDFDYSGGGGLDDNLNRVSAIINHTGPVTLASYTYLGAGTVIRIDYQGSVRLDLWGGSSGTFNGFDRFGRIIDQRWVTTGGSPTDRDRYQYGYDRNSNRFYKQNTVASTSPPLDEFYTYDNLNRLNMMQRGTLTGGPPFTGISGTPVREMDYTLDHTGNWKAYLTKTSGSTDLNQTRTHTTVNEISGISQGGGDPVWVDPAYDAAGNTTTVPSGLDPTIEFTAVYDAWNRMVSVTKVSTGHLVAEYQYDGRGRRIVKKTYNPATGSLAETRDFYWSNAWQNLEERVGGSSSADVQQVWGIRYVDELICRDDNTRRLYACQDANFNVTCLLDTSGAVQQRFVYDPYGQSSVRDKTTWAVTTDAYAWQFRHQGLTQDVETGFIYNRRRYLQVQLGRFLRRDPLSYVDGMGLYQYEMSNSSLFLDPRGTDTCGPNVTEWFINDLRNQLGRLIAHYSDIDLARAKNMGSGIFADLEDLGANLAAIELLENAYKWTIKYELSYKWMNFSAPGTGTGLCCNTVEIAGMCVRKNQLGYIAFAYISQKRPPNPTVQSGENLIEAAYRLVGFYDKAHPHAANFGTAVGALRNDNLAAFSIGANLAAQAELNAAALGTALAGNRDIYAKFNSDLKGAPLPPGALTWIPEYGGFDTATCTLSGVNWAGGSSHAALDALKSTFSLATGKTFSDDADYAAFDAWLQSGYEDYWGVGPGMPPHP